MEITNIDALPHKGLQRRGPTIYVEQTTPLNTGLISGIGGPYILSGQIGPYLSVLNFPKPSPSEETPIPAVLVELQDFAKLLDGVQNALRVADSSYLLSLSQQPLSVQLALQSGQLTGQVVTLVTKWNDEPRAFQVKQLKRFILAGGIAITWTGILAEIAERFHVTPATHAFLETVLLLVTVVGTLTDAAGQIET
jgi:hypothetical protein